MSATGRATSVQHVMNTQPSDFGRMGAAGVRDLVKRATGHAPVATYVENEQPPISWEALSGAGWDSFGIIDDGEGPSSRDLLAVASAWGFGCVQLPLLTTMLARRHSALARTVDGPVTFRLPHGTESLIPHGATPGTHLIEDIGTASEHLGDLPRGATHDLDLAGRGLVVQGSSTLPSALARELAIVLGGEAHGGAERLLVDTVTFVKEREQFGRPVGSFQAVKHHLADALIAVESAETSLIWASEDPGHVQAGALFAVDRCIDVAEIAIQAHGGLGFTWEVGLHFQLRTMLSARRIIEQLVMADA